MSDDEILHESSAEAFNNSDKKSIDSNKNVAQKALQFVLEWVLMVFL